LRIPDIIIINKLNARLESAVLEYVLVEFYTFLVFYKVDGEGVATAGRRSWAQRNRLALFSLEHFKILSLNTGIS
jgi:hypothetical protein